jgi:predicted nucleotidyltransferase component of viral defense system
MNRVANFTAEQRKSLFLETGNAIGLDINLVEKDFWVCWTLKLLFSIPELKEHLIFKGGTTLSKIYGIIDRFSEDIDLTIERTGFNFADNPETATSRKKSEQIISEMMKACSLFICGKLRDLLFKQIESQLGKPKKDHQWDVTIYQKDSDRQTLQFHYPVVGAISEYNPSAVRLEFGSKSDIWPVKTAKVISYAAEQFPNYFNTPEYEVTALCVARTFWEKATILHQVTHWPKNKPLLHRYSRHYYDMAMLADSKFCNEALKELDLLSRVVEHKMLYFRCGWANYETAIPGTFKLIPSSIILTELEKDYKLMEPMLFGNIPIFADIIKKLTELEQRINSL